jgi:hypothetical protein
LKLACYLSISLLLSLTVQSQEIVSDPSEIINLFNPERIKSSNISEVRADYSFKYDTKVIVQTKRYAIYEFNDHGFVKSITEIKKVRGRLDSVITYLYWNGNREVSTKVVIDNWFTQIEMFEYEDERLSRHSFYQMKKRPDWNEHLSNKKLMWSDSIWYEDNYVVHCNRWGVNYKRYYLKKDDDGQIISISEYDRAKKLVQTMNYTYDDYHLVQIEQINTMKYMFDWKQEFSYNSDLVSEEKYYKDNRLEYVRRISYLENGLPELDLKRNERTKKMFIVQFEYSKN